MKRVMVLLPLVFFMVIFGAESSYARMCGCMDGMGEGMHEGMPMKGEMGHHGMGGKRGMTGEDHPMWNHLMGLGLDAKQKDASIAIKRRVMKDTIKKRADRQVAKLELQDILDKDPVDMKTVEAKLKQMEAIETDIQLSHIRAMEEVKAVLTPEQKKKMKEMIDRGPMGGGMGMMEGRGMMHRGGMGMMEGCGMMHRGGREMMSSPEKQEEKQPPMEHKHH